MKKRILLFTVIAGFGYIIFSSFLTGPGYNGFDCTGAETGSGNVSGCYVAGYTGGCHAVTPTAAITLAIEIDSAGVAVSSTATGLGRFKPGFTYTVKITGTNTTSATLPKFGFQVGCIQGGVSLPVPVNAGTLQSTGLPTGVAYIAGPGGTTGFVVNVVEHSNSLPATTAGGATGGTYVESFTWTAPTVASGVDTVSFWGALNAVNGDGLATTADKWNVNHLVLAKIPVSTSVASISNSLVVKAYPNPVINNLNLQIDNAQTGNYSLQVFDLSGKLVIIQQIEINAAMQLTSINTANWMPGMYEVVVEKDGNRQLIPVIKQ